MRKNITLVLIFTALGFAQTAETPARPPATLYVYREKAVFKTRLSHPSIYCDGKELTRIHQGTFFETTLPPGKHMITLGRTEVGQFLNMDSGESYYFRFGHKNLFVTGVSGREPLTLTPVDEATARKEMDGLKQASK